MIPGDAKSIKKQYEAARRTLIKARLDVQLLGGTLLAQYPENFILSDVGSMLVSEQVEATPEVDVCFESDSDLVPDNAAQEEAQEEAPFTFMYGASHYSLHQSMVDKIAALDEFSPKLLRAMLRDFPPYDSKKHTTLNWLASGYASYVLNQGMFRKIRRGHYTKVAPKDEKVAIAESQLSEDEEDGIAESHFSYVYAGQKRWLKKAIVRRLVARERFRWKELMSILDRLENRLTYDSRKSLASVYVSYLVESGIFVKLARGVYERRPPEVPGSDIRVVENGEGMPHIIDGVLTYENRPEEGYGRK